jgi:PAS domain S-box-containing protein
MCDLVALSALPAVWAGFPPRQVAEGLADVLLATLRLELVHLRLRGQPDGQEIEVFRTAGPPPSTEQVRDIRRALVPWLMGARPGAVPVIPNPVGPGTVRLVSDPIGCDGTDGLLVAASRQPGFPSEEDHLFLRVAANQAAAVLQQQRAEAALRESEERYRSVIAAMQEGVVLLGDDGSIRACNASAERILGLSAEQITGRTPFDPRWQAIHEDGSPFPGDTHPLMVTLRTGRPCSNVVMGVRKPNGQLTWVSINSQPLLRGNEPTPYAVVASFSDITERKNTEEALRESEHRWRSLTETVPQLVWTATPDGILDYYSAQTVQYIGRPESELLGWGWLELLHPEDRERTRQAWRAAVAGRSEYEIEHRFRRFDGTYRWFKTRGVAIRDSEGNVYKWFGTSTDITTDKQLEEELRQANERLELAVRGSYINVWELDLPDGVLESGRLTASNLWEALGYERPQAPPDYATVTALLHPDDRAAVQAAMRRYLAGETGEFEIEIRFRHEDGSYRWMLSRAVAVRDARGKPIRFVGSGVDITERKRADEALRESEQRWRSLTEALPQLVWAATPDGSCDYFSTQWTQHTGVPQSELLGWRWLETLHPDDRERTRRVWLDSVAGRGPYDVEYRVRRRDGVHRWFKTRGVPIRDGEGNIVKWFGTCTDITDLRQTEVQLRASEERFRGTFENAAVGIAHTDLEGRFLRVNEKLCHILGCTREELLTKKVQDITCPEDWTTDLSPLHSLLRGEVPSFSRDKRYLRKDGSPVWVAVSVSLQRDAAGTPLNTISVARDISHRKRLETELRQAKEAAESANRAKDEFLANVSHEIRTPMNAILGMTELVLDTPLTEDQRQCLQTVKSAADNLLGVINDLLDFARIEAGKLELDPADFSLRAALADTLRTLAVRAHSKGLELIYQVQPAVPDALVGDAGRLRQVLLNLVGNALKFTEEGEVVVRVEAAPLTPPPPLPPGGEGEPEIPAPPSPALGEGEPEIPAPPSPALGEGGWGGEGVALRFTVLDTGIGIPKEKQERIFRAFEQEDTSTTRKYCGTGLGLTIAARLVGLMGGQLTVDSAPGRGSTFAFTARFGLQPQPRRTDCQSVLPPVLLRDLPVLIVDDNATNRHILVEWLRGWQMGPMAVGDGVAAMDALWDAVSTGHPYALVLLDARMPDTDGLALAARIRKRAELSDTRIILLTSGERPADRDRSSELRIDARLLKPVQQEELLETIYRVLRKEEGGRTEEEPARSSESSFLLPPSAFPLNILVAEDNEFSARLMERLLARGAHRMRLATNGREALALAQEGGFDLLLLDIHMPRLDGFGVVEAIRQRERVAGGHLPVIALTARARREDRERCLAAGMDDFLTKPIAPAALFAAIDRLLRKEEGGRRKAEKQDRSASDSSSLLPPSSPARSLLDPGAVLRACGDDAEGLRRMCRDFQTYAPARLAELGDALRERDAPRLRQVAHKFCALLFAFSSVAGDVASDLEDLADEGRLEEARPLVERLETMTRELLRVADGLSLDTLRQQAEAAGGS